MRKFKNPLKCIAFVAILLVLLNLLSQLFMPKNDFKEIDSKNSVAHAFLNERENSIDVLILGDSEAYASFSPMQLYRDFGFTTYNCGTSRQYIQDSYDFLQAFVDRQSPEIVVLEANLLYRSDGKSGDRLRTFQNNIRKLVPIFEFHNRWKDVSLKGIKSKEDLNWRDENKGFRLNNQVKAYKGKEYMKPCQTSQSITNTNEDYFTKIVDYCKEKGVTLVLVNTLSPKNWTYEKHNGVQKLADEKGVPYLDMNILQNEIKVNWKKDTYDKGDHLNLRGAKKVTDYFGRYLVDNFNLPDKRNDADYADWNDDLQKYLDNIDKL